MAAWRDRIQEAAEQRLGVAVVPQEHLDLLETVSRDYSAMRKELDLLGWSVMDYMSGNPQQPTANSRRKFAQQARVVWESDPQAGTATDLLNDFVFGRGVPKPRAKDPKVQEILDESWADADNQMVLTSHSAQVALGTDLMLQSNVFLVMFDDGEDGKVKLGLLDHDGVETVVTDPDNRLRVLYYVARQHRVEWDYDNDKVKTQVGQVDRGKIQYFEHWRNVADLEESGVEFDKPPKEKMGDGRVFHLAVNRRQEQVFGTPTMRRTIRWISAYNDFLSARVDMTQAAAAFIMKRKVQGTPTQVAKLAAKAISRESALATSFNTSGDPVPGGPRTASTISENQGVEHEPFNLDTRAGNAAQDADLLLGQSSMATPFPKHYYGGDPGSLAGATSVELPVLKRIESFQEVVEEVFRWYIDRTIERAVDAGRLDKYADETEEEGATRLDPGADTADTGVFGNPASTELSAAYDGSGDDEERTERDLSYEFSMPSPLRRMMTDLVSAVSNIAKTFDPNATNVELSKTLLTIALGEGLEVDDPAEAVELIFPEGYQDPAVAAAMAAAQGANGPPGSDTGQYGPEGNPQGEGNPYGAPMQSSPPEEMQQSAVTTRRDGAPAHWVQEMNVGDLPDDHRDRAAMRKRSVEEDFDAEVSAIAMERLEALLVIPSSNGNGSGPHH